MKRPFLPLCHLSSGTCGILKKQKNKKIYLKFFHLYNSFGRKRVFSTFLQHKIVSAALKILMNTENVRQ